MKAILLHGTDGDSESNWIPWIRSQLEKRGCEVYSPSLPNSAFPNGDEWSDFVLENTPFKIDEETIIVGHSAGAALIPMILQKLPITIKRAVLVSGFHTDLGWEKLKNLQNVTVDYVGVRQKAEDFIIVYSDNDPYVALAESEWLIDKLNARSVLIKNQGHFNLGASPKYKEFPKLLAIILKENVLQNLYLTSSFRGKGVANLVINDIERLLGKTANEIRVLYITTAGNLHPKEQRVWIDEGRKILQEHGWQVFDYDIENKSEMEVEEVVSQSDVIFVQGGQCIYMLEQAQKCKLGEIVKRALAKGVPYIGESTGSIIAGRDISAYRFLANDRRENPPVLENYNGFGLVNFLIKPHWNNPDKLAKYEANIVGNFEKFFEINEPIIFLNDNQLVRVEGDNFQIWEGVK